MSFPLFRGSLESFCFSTWGEECNLCDGCESVQECVSAWWACLTAPRCRWCRDCRPPSTPVSLLTRTCGARWRCSAVWCGRCCARAWGRWWPCSGSGRVGDVAGSEPLTCSCATCGSALPPPSRCRRLPWERGHSKPRHGSAAVSRTSPPSWTWTHSTECHRVLTYSSGRYRSDSSSMTRMLSQTIRSVQSFPKYTNSSPVKNMHLSNAELQRKGEEPVEWH